MSHALRRTLGGLCAALAALAASLTYGSMQARWVTGDPEVFGDAAEAALADPAVVDVLAGTVGDSIEQQLAGFLPTTDVAGVDGSIRRIAEDAVASPAFAAAFASTLEEVHAYLFGDRTTVPTLDTGVLTGAVRAAAVEVDPVYGTLLAPGAELEVEVPVETLPDLRQVPRLAEQVQLAAFLAAIVLALTALAVHPLPHKVVRRFAGWAIATGALSVALPTLGPWLLPALAGENGAFAGPFVGRITERFLLPGLCLLAAGTALFALSIHLARQHLAGQRLAQRHHARHQLAQHRPAPVAPRPGGGPAWADPAAMWSAPPVRPAQPAPPQPAPVPSSLAPPPGADRPVPSGVR